MGIELTDENGKRIEPAETTHVLMASAEGATLAMAFTPDYPAHIDEIFGAILLRQPVRLPDGKFGKLYVPPREAMIMVRVLTTAEFDKEMAQQRFAMMQQQGRRQ